MTYLSRGRRNYYQPLQFNNRRGQGLWRPPSHHPQGQNTQERNAVLNDIQQFMNQAIIDKHQAIIDVTGQEMTLYGQKVSLTSRADEDKIGEEALHMDEIKPSEPRPIHLPLILPYAVDVAPEAAKVIFLDVSNKEKDPGNEYIVDPLQCNGVLDEKHIYIARSINRCIQCPPSEAQKTPKYVIPVQIVNMN
jgi:hypothetical protein